MKTENILFLSKRVGVPNTDKTKVNQLAITAETLKSAYDSLPASVTGKNFEGKDITVQTENLPDTVKKAAFEKNGLTIDVSVQDGDLLLGNTTMTASLLSAIKKAEGALTNTPYYITVTDSSKADPKTKVARIAFSLVDGKVETKLVNLK